MEVAVVRAVRRGPRQHPGSRTLTAGEIDRRDEGRGKRPRVSRGGIMAGEPLGVCIDRLIPEELEGVARAKNALEHGQSAPSPLEMALVSAKMWKPGRTLRVCFLDGDARVHEKIASYAKQWMEHANIVLDFVSGKTG